MEPETVTASPAQRLSPRQRECLHLLWSERATSKEIAQRLRISPSTVDGYIAEAVHALGARDRRHAALIAFGAPVHPPPDNRGGDVSRVPEAIDWRAWLPLRTGAHNDLSIAARLFWIVFLAVLVAIGFGALAGGTRVISDLIR